MESVIHTNAKKREQNKRVGDTNSRITLVVLSSVILPESIIFDCFFQRSYAQNGASPSSTSPVHKPTRNTLSSNGRITSTGARGDVKSIRKVCNEDMVPQPVMPEDGAEFDFTAHMKSVRPSFNRFGQHEPATVRLNCRNKWWSQVQTTVHASISHCKL